MNKLRFYNARILTTDPQGQMEIITGEIWTEDLEITLVGAPTLPYPIFTQQIDVENHLILPGFINAHAHAPMVFLRSIADDLPLQQWLEQRVFPMEAKLTEEQAYHLTKLAILEYISSGITTSFEMYLYPYAMAKAAAEQGFQMVLCGALNDFTHSLEELEAQYLTLNAYHPAVSMRLGFHGEYTTSPELLQGVAELASKYRAPVFTHLSETKAEVESCLARHGKTPPQYLWDLGIWDYGGGGFHCVHMTPEDHGLFQREKLSTITCPGSNTKLASGIPDLVQRQGHPVGIGTDGAASNNALNFFREMYLTSVLQKLRTGDASAVPAQEVLYWATAGGSQVLNLPQSGRIAPGQYANLAIINMQTPNMQPEHNILDNIVYSGSKQNVWMTVCGGRILYHKGQFYTKQNPQEIYQNAAKIVRDLVS